MAWKWEIEKITDQAGSSYDDSEPADPRINATLLFPPDSSGQDIPVQSLTKVIDYSG